MLISKAYAAAEAMSNETLDLTNAPTPFEAFMLNIGLVVVLVVLFYVLLIMPQQRRFKEHSDMLADLKKGDRVVTGGGLVGKIEKLIDDKEVLIDLGSGVKVTALRSMIQGKTEIKPAANDSKKSEKKAEKPEKAEEEKSAPKKKADAPAKKKATKKEADKA